MLGKILLLVCINVKLYFKMVLQALLSYLLKSKHNIKKLWKKRRRNITFSFSFLRNKHVLLFVLLKNPSYSKWFCLVVLGLFFHCYFLNKSESYVSYYLSRIILISFSLKSYVNFTFQRELVLWKIWTQTFAFNTMF